jgi:hypothetical protein
VQRVRDSGSPGCNCVVGNLLPCGSKLYELEARLLLEGDGLATARHYFNADFLAASDIGKREIEVGGKMCVEYYSYKDGLPVKTLCQQ